MANQHKYKLIRPRSALLDALPGQYPESVNVAISRYLFLVSNPPKFSEAEWSLLKDACNGWWTQGEPPELLVQGLALQVDDAMTLEGLAAKWKVSSPDLRQKLENLTPLETMSVIHAVECFWSNFRAAQDSWLNHVENLQSELEDGTTPQSWIDQGFDFEEAWQWRQAGAFNPERTKELADAGYDPDDVSRTVLAQEEVDLKIVYSGYSIAYMFCNCDIGLEDVARMVNS